MKKSLQLILSATLLSLISRTIPANAAAITNPMFEEMGNNVKVTFGLDERLGDFLSLPDMFDIDITLFEDNFIGDNELGKKTIWLKKNEVIPTGGGGWQKDGLMLIFEDASNAFTGDGSDYYLEAGEIYQSTPEPGEIYQSTPEPTSTLAFLTLGILGAASLLKRKLKSSKSDNPWRKDESHRCSSN